MAKRRLHREAHLLKARGFLNNKNQNINFEVKKLFKKIDLKNLNSSF